MWNRLLLSVGLILPSVIGPLEAVVSAAEKRPNVVIIVADDLGFQLGCYGDKLAKTPNIDALAAQGTRFTRAYCTTASCSASRSVILSGLYNHATGHFGHAHGYNHFSTYDTVHSLPVLLNKAGYRTCLIGKYHLAPEPIYHFEFERQQDTQGHRNTVRMARNAKEWITEADDRPFFLYFCPTDPHRGGDRSHFANQPDKPDFYPEIPPTIYQPDQITVPSWLPDLPEVRQELCEYYRAIARLDVGLGDLFRTLKETGHWDNTLIFFLSDNGPPFPGAKTTCYEPGINLPLIVRDPRQKQQGTICEAMVTWADLTPTVLNYCGVETPDAAPVRPVEVGSEQARNLPARAGKNGKYQFHGRSFAGVLGQPTPENWDTLYASHTFHEITMYYPMRVVRVGNYKYILNIANGLEYPFASDLFESPTWQAVLKRDDPQQYYGRRSVDAYLHRAKHELYDLAADPDETRNLAEEPEHRELLKRLQTQLQEWQQQTQDPWELKWRYE
ncbi:sulfatase-like hydrolase/transferase [bacterium]|nr:sulfatase-like hydrolase/transferase [bacterium]